MYLKVKLSVIIPVAMLTPEKTDASTRRAVKRKGLIVVVHPGNGGSEDTRRKQVCDQHLLIKQIFQLAQLIRCQASSVDD